MESLGKMLILFGVIIALVGVFMTFVPKIPLLGKLPGDIYIERKGMVFYFPIVTSLIISLILTVVLNILLRR